jgi:hypothetical protein
MNREDWQDREGHPPAGVLLLHAQDELDGAAADAVRAHLEQCGPCRAMRLQLQHGESRFIAFRDSVVVPGPAPRSKVLRERLARMETKASSKPFIERLRGLIRINMPGRLAFALGGVSICLIVFVSYYLSAPRQSVYASQLLDDARNASDSLISHSKVLNQKIELRRGNLVIRRTVHHGRQVALQTHDSSIDPQLEHELNLAHVDLDDPLSANDFAAWRASQQGDTDSVKETSQSVIITTRVPGAEIAAGSLTLSRSGWRPIARSVEVRGEAPIEISEVSYDISDTKSSVPESAIGALAPGDAPNEGGGGNTSSTTPQVSATELETSELDLREALHTIGADASAGTAIWTSNHTVFFHISNQIHGQEAAIRETSLRIPHVKEADREAARLPARIQPLEGAGPYTTTPPLAAALQQKLGDAQAANIFLNSFRARSSHVLAEAAALDQFGKRYPVDTIKTLPPDLRARVNSLAAAMLSSLQRAAADYVKLLSPPLDDIARDLNVSAAADDNSNLPGCLSWQQNAALASPQLQGLARDVSLLFIPNRSESPVEPAAGKLLSDSLGARAFLDAHLMSTCQLFGPN